ncbi:MAG: hypothetical protein ACLQLH_08770 [Terracidiphilus sp.]
MSQTFWENEVAEELHTEQPVTEPQVEAQLTEFQPQPEEPHHEPVADSGTLAVSGDEFSALEERILRTVNLVKQERLGRVDAEERVAQLEAQLREHAPLVEQLQKEVKALSAERDHVRQRVERLLWQLDALEL